MSVSDDDVIAGTTLVPSDPWPFKNHRTLAQVIWDEEPHIRYRVGRFLREGDPRRSIADGLQSLGNTVIGD